MPPDLAEGLKDEVEDLPYVKVKSHSPEKSNRLPNLTGPFSTREAYRGDGSDRALIQAILCYSEKPPLDASVKGQDSRPSGVGVVASEDSEAGKSSVVESLTLEPDNIARVVPGRIMNVRFFPSANARMVVVGNKFGDLGFWNMDSEKEEEHGIFLYHPHSGPISGISIHHSSLSKIFTSCYDGFIRLMDVDKELFNLVYSTDDTIYSLSQQSDDVKCLYFGEGHGGLKVLDEREEKPSRKWVLHEDRINTIDFNPGNPNIMATSSTDWTVRIWDLRNINAKKPGTIKIINHKKAVHSAYFSPSGSCLATTSADNTIGIISGADFEDICMVYHDNFTGRWISSFRAIWGWDDSCVFVGNMKRGVDVISPAQKTTITTLYSPHMSAIPCRFDKHPHRVGMLAAATSGGQVYTWTSS